MLTLKNISDMYLIFIIVILSFYTFGTFPKRKIMTSIVWGEL